MRNAIMGIIGYSEMLMENTEDKVFDGRLADLQKVLISGKELLNLVNDMFNQGRRNVQTSSVIHEFNAKLREGTSIPISVINRTTKSILDEIAQKREIGDAEDLKMILKATRRVHNLVNHFEDSWLDSSDAGQIGMTSDKCIATGENSISSAPVSPVEGLAPKNPICGNILIVDDNRQNRDLLFRKLGRDSNSVSVAASGREALDMLRNASYDIILLDLMMPGRNGYEVLQDIKSDDSLRNIPVIMLSGLDEIDHVARCIELGAEDYLQKPYDTVLLKARIGACLERKKLRDMEEAYLEHQRFQRIRKALDETVQAMALAFEMKDPFTAGHQRRVSELCCAIATEMDLSNDTRECLRFAGTIHDIGKISVPAEILSKPTKLNDAETFLLQTHSQVGYDILKKIEFPWPVARIILQHHERLDGSGYPNHLSGEAILFEAKILAVADVLEAIALHRPYRPSLGIDQALAEITLNRGVLYDPDAVDACLRLFKEKGYKINW